MINNTKMNSFKFYFLSTSRMKRFKEKALV
jgi:hypothetical protein